MAKPAEKGSLFEKLMLELNHATVKNKTVFFRLLSVSQKAGLGLKEALNSILHSERNYGMKIIIKGLESQINEGISLATAMQRYDYFFGNDEIELVRASESIGNMPDILLNIAEELENFQRTKNKIKSAMMYPIILLVFAILAV
ncbi:type II secretion system F family protein [Patescibacteria group bacterium]|nr:type II secretion system F family protein [Patescibacteria group bacterium]